MGAEIVFQIVALVGQKQIRFLAGSGLPTPRLGVEATHWRGRILYIQGCGLLCIRASFEIRDMGAAAEGAGHLDGQTLDGPLHRLGGDAALPLEQGLRLGFLEYLYNVGRDSP